MATVVKSSSQLRRQALIAGGIILVILAPLFTSYFLAQFFHRALWFVTIFYIILALTARHIFNRCLIYIRGFFGELTVFRTLLRLPDAYHLFSDVTVVADGHAAQIDHVIVAPSGVWCVETKSHLGTVYGKERDHEWTQVKRSDRGRKYSHRFYSPVKQNAVHCQRLRAYLRTRLGLDIPVHSVVVFSSATLKVATTTPVVSPKALLPILQAGYQTCAIADRDVQGIVAALNACQGESGVTAMHRGTPVA